MAFIDNIQNCLFTTKYPNDKVGFKSQGSVSVTLAATPADYTTVTIPHGLGYAPLVVGSYSDDNFATTYGFGAPPYAYNATFALWLPSINGIVESDSTNIYIYLQNLLPTRTFYYRVAALIPSGITSSPAMDADTRDSEYFNTTDNFMKILIDDQEERTFTGSASQLITIPHNLGYPPLAFVFSEESGIVRRVGAENTIITTGITNTSYVDSTNLYINADITFAATMNFYYRIYLDA